MNCDKCQKPQHEGACFPRKKLTLKERKVIKEVVVNGLTQVEAVQKVYDVAPHNAKTLASQVFSRPVVRSGVVEELDKLYPSLNSIFATRLMRTVEEGSDRDALAAIKFIAELRGELGARAIESVTTQIPAKPLLPEE